MPSRKKKQQTESVHEAFNPLEQSGPVFNLDNGPHGWFSNHWVMYGDSENESSATESGAMMSATEGSSLVSATESGSKRSAPESPTRGQGSEL